MNNNYRNIALLIAFISLAACGTMKHDRVLSGGGIGAGVGAVTGAAVGGSPLTGAAIGGAVGAATGAIVKESDMNLGKPVWRRK